MCKLKYVLVTVVFVVGISLVVAGTIANPPSSASGYLSIDE
jgi:hypothetical protein